MDALPSGSVIGILGGGQLGRMTALAAARLGYATHIFCQKDDEPAVEVSGNQTFAPFDDDAELERFALSVDVVTLEWENVPLRALDTVERMVPLRPGRSVMEVAQDRGLEKTYARANGIGTADFTIVRSAADLAEALKKNNGPAILKSTRMGYDGKGQVRITPGLSAAEAWASMGASEGILESFVDFEGEVSVIVARGEEGAMKAFPPVRNEHKNQILSVTHAPSGFAPEVEREATDLACRMAESLRVVGLLSVEMFVLPAPDALGRRVLLNEIAPRPHNSGHWTIDACACSQYEQLVRAVCGLPLADPAPHSRATMHNLIGDDVAKVPDYLTQSGACVHLYGKKDVREGRKMGHVTLLGGAW